MRAIFATMASTSFTPMVFLRLPSAASPGGADFVDDVDRLVRQLAVVDVARDQLDRRADRLGGVAHLVVLLVIGLQAAQDLHGILDRRLVDVDLLEAVDERAVLLEVAAIFVGGRADAADGAALQRRFPAEFDASMAPPVAPARSMGISSMKRMAPSCRS
jgi:hypothetical protein